MNNLEIIVNFKTIISIPRKVMEINILDYGKMSKSNILSAHCNSYMSSRPSVPVFVALLVINIK